MVRLWRVLVLLAWLATPESFPRGPLPCLIAWGVGAFVGGELFVVLGGPTTHEPDGLTVLGAISGGPLCLELVSRLPRLPPVGLPAANTRAGLVWLSLQAGAQAV